MNLKLPKRVHVEMILHLAKDFLEDEDHSVVSEVKEACEKALNEKENNQEISLNRARRMLRSLECRSVAHVTEPVSDFIGLMDEDAAALRGLGNIAAAKAVEHWAWRVKLLFGIAAGEHPHNAKNTEQESVTRELTR